jgi:hypothetical protein
MRLNFLLDSALSDIDQPDATRDGAGNQIPSIRTKSYCLDHTRLVVIDPDCINLKSGLDMPELHFRPATVVRLAYR